MNSLLKKIVWVIILLPAIYLAFIWQRLPEKIPSHFDLHGNADKMGSRNELLTLLIILTLLNAGVFLLLTNIYRIDPKKYAAENKDRLYRIAFAVSVFLALVCVIIIYGSEKGSLKFGLNIILSAVGLLFALIGNYMHNIKPNYFAGFRLPWTLENPENWRKTHLLAGKLWFIAGLSMTIVCILLPPLIAFITFFTITMAVTIIPAVYSYKLYKRSTRS